MSTHYPSKSEHMAPAISTATCVPPVLKSRKRSTSSNKSSNDSSKDGTDASSLDTQETKSPISVVEALIRGHCEGWIEEGSALSNIDCHWYRATVSTPDFVALIRRLDVKIREWMLSRLTYDWNAFTGQIILRNMAPANTNHDYVAAQIGKVLGRQIENLLEDQETPLKMKEVLERIEGPLSTMASPVDAPDVEDENPEVTKLLKSKRQPDNSFYFMGRTYMPIVVEVANSQKSEDLEALVIWWMKDTGLKTKTVITVDMMYQGPAARHGKFFTPDATIAVHRLRDTSTLEEVEYDVQSFKFRDSSKGDGDQSQEVLWLTVADFLPPSKIAGFPEGYKFPAITLTAIKLREILTKGDTIQQHLERESRSPGSSESPPNKKKPAVQAVRPPPPVAEPTRTRSGRESRKPRSPYV
ncbi:hypothetical protein HBI49_153450 [Parastagonospora nodorum]|nr:hypothetical protein HBH51_039210 [Parastagonospora nodorum]KAH5080741.1 hypothetical protein HBH95_067660 [Parastagonospora nodorum]KAH5356792.1 hypothetical protein HBI49_153450 [Parastagonospora nodorum]KAH5452058.1 hypothetical protein HBI30_116620 [Parastagonospora nodorum]